MRRPTVRRVFVPLAIVALTLLGSSGRAAAPEVQQRSGARPQSTAAQRRPAQSGASNRSNPTRSNSANRQNANRRPVRTARNQSRPVTQQPVKPDAKTKAEFQKLIGANWIWSPAHVKDAVPVGDCYFRKTITTEGDVDFAQIHVACDNHYELFVNGQAVGSGADWRKMDVHEVVQLFRPGVNVVAIKATNTDGGAAGLVARVIIKQKGGTYENFNTDDSWRTSVKEAANWKAPDFRDREWLAAKVYGSLGAVLPWGDEVVISNEGSRFMIDPEFAIDRVVTDEQAGSLIAMAFDANGDILASQEGGPLLLIRDKDRDGSFETVVTFCDKLKNVQGILSLGSQVLAVGDGPDGGALYRLNDIDALGRSTAITPLVKFRGLIGEHGPHAVQLGPEGFVYVLCGNFARVDAEAKASSPYGATYEGDLVVPRYEDPQGFAAGVPAPGGTIIRTDTRGSFVETVAGGMRNPYDFAFNAEGELFTYDADMEWDIGTPWYRPTRVNHVPPGAELGWRSGWAKWPEFYLDSLPATVDVGPGSPTGVEHYDHVAFPKRFQNALFVGDWALGHIHAVHLERKGAGYTGRLTTILKGRPLNVTDLAVGPDGALYFSTGGRGTDGGVYRLRWTGNVPPESLQLGQGIQQALRQPQFQSDWARRRIAQVQKQLGNRWESELERVIADPRSRPSDRLRAIDLMTFFGPPPTVKSLVSLSRDRDPAVRAKVARLMGTQENDEFTQPLTKLLRDPDPMVRRVACESIEHRGSEPPVDALVTLLGDSDRHVAYAARKTLERIPSDTWREQVLTSEKPRVFLQGSTGLLAAAPTPELAKYILTRCDALLQDRIERGDRAAPNAAAEAEFRDTLRVIELALIRGPIPAAEANEIAKLVVAVYPTTDALANRELVRLLVHLQPPEAAALLTEQLQSNIGEVEKLQIASHAARLTTGWTTPEKLVMLRYFETVRGLEGGHSVKGYLENFARDFFTNLTLAERKQVLAAGEKFPTSALSILAKLPSDAGPEVWTELRALDQRIEGIEGEHYARLRVGITAVLGGSGNPDSYAYLREVYQSDPNRRAPIAMSLTQAPQGANWPILVDSLRSVDGVAAPEVLAALTKVPLRPKESEAYRNVILTGLKMPSTAGDLSVRVLEHWTGQKRDADAETPVRLASWQAWYAEQFPDALPAELPQDSHNNKWSYEELASFLESPDGKAGNASRGTRVFTTAQCINCHRFNGTGENIGPDLTAVSQRFQKREVLESIIYPSHVVSDQYGSHSVTANGRTYVGIVARQPDGSVTVLQSDGGKTHIAADDIEEIEPSKLSAMPEGLLNTLTLDQVADLFALLMEGGNTSMAGRPAATR